MYNDFNTNLTFSFFFFGMLVQRAVLIKINRHSVK